MYTSCIMLFIREPKQTEERHQPCQSSINHQICSAQVRAQRLQGEQKKWCKWKGRLQLTAIEGWLWFFNLLGHAHLLEKTGMLSPKNWMNVLQANGQTPRPKITKVYDRRKKRCEALNQNSIEEIEVTTFCQDGSWEELEVAHSSWAEWLENNLRLQLSNCLLCLFLFNLVILGLLVLDNCS